MRIVTNDIQNLVDALSRETGRKFYFQGGNYTCGISHSIYTQDDKPQVMLRGDTKSSLYWVADAFLKGYNAAKES